jgi:hypothetical protein
MFEFHARPNLCRVIQFSKQNQKCFLLNFKLYDEQIIPKSRCLSESNQANRRKTVGAHLRPEVDGGSVNTDAERATEHTKDGHRKRR